MGKTKLLAPIERVDVSHPLKGDFGECIFQDCVAGLRDLAQEIADGTKERYDLMLSDPPYNTGGTPGINRNLMKRKGVKKYSDDMPFEEYMAWCKEWYELCKQVATRIVLTPGYNNFKWWFIMIDDELEWLVHYNQGRGAESLNCKMSLMEPILTWNVNKDTGKIPVSVFEDRGSYKHLELEHPCPKNPRLWEWLIDSLHPTSIVDPFLGSGTTAQLCEKKGISWLGFDLPDVDGNGTNYGKDIKLRIHVGKNERISAMQYHPKITRNAGLGNFLGMSA